jgi:Rrf2 family nitric oxide-sensitive transcriptional repressor
VQLTRFTDLGMRAVMLLAAGDPGEHRVTTRQIAIHVGASENHIAKAISRLAELGLVHARRGRLGGLTLTDAGRGVSIGWLIRELEGDRDVVDCDGAAVCPLIAGCRLRRALAEAKSAFYAELDRYTVADLVRTPALQLLTLTPMKRNP